MNERDGRNAGAPGQSTARSVLRLGEGDDDDAFDRVVVEEPLEIRVRGEPIAVTMRTPGDDEELAIGFLVTEGVLGDPRQVRAISRPEPNAIDIDAEVDARAAKRALYSASSCGLCGKATITAITVRVAPIEARTPFSRAVLLAMSDRMRAAQPTFDRTGGLHAAALFDARGTLVSLREDIGRHNATDKVIGRAFLDGVLDEKALLVSGRAGFEIVQKAAVARIELVAAISASSSLAIDLADRVGITMVAFLRPPRASIYTHPSRVVEDARAGAAPSMSGKPRDTTSSSGR
jgi:FdhD protein